MQARTSTFQQNRQRETVQEDFNPIELNTQTLNVPGVYTICPFKVAVFFFMVLVLVYLHKIAYK